MAKLFFFLLALYLVYRLVRLAFRMGRASRVPLGGNGGGALDALDLLARLEAQHPQAQELRVPVLVVRLGVYLAAADGHVDPREIQAIRRFFLRPGMPHMLVALLDQVLSLPARAAELPRLLEALRAVADRDDREVILYALLAIAAADGQVAPAEIALFRSIAGQLGLSEGEIDAILREALGRAATGLPQPDPGRAGRPQPGPAAAEPAPPSDHDVLGVTPGASRDEIRKAYRELARKYHPDRVAHLGAEFKELAEARMAQINAAYERLGAST